MCKCIIFIFYLLDPSKKVKLIWNKICDHKYVYLIIALAWILPILINLPERFEPGIDYAPGNGTGVGYVCYAVEGGKLVVFTKEQWIFSLVTDIFLFTVIIISYLVAWCGIKKETAKTRSVILERGISTRQSRLFEFKTHTKSIQRDLRLTISLICLSWVIFRLPLIILGRAEIDSNTFNFLFAMYSMQFCIHFIMYAIVEKSYRSAYKDILNEIFSCFFN